jgi:hypothetical protein
MARQPFLPHKLEPIIVEFCSQGPVTLDALAKHVNRSHDHLGRLVRSMKAAGHVLEVDGIGTARGVLWRDDGKRLKKGRFGIPHEKEASFPFTCVECKLPGLGYSPNAKRCDDCLSPSGLPTTARKYDPRWRPVFERNIPKGGCLVCGSPRAKTRDGRWCHWTHDLSMLEAHEADALLEEYAGPSRDVWGRLIGV